MAATLFTVILAATPVPLIIDTDMGGGGCRDVDDVAAVCMASALHHRGEAKLLAVMHNTMPPAVAGVTSALLTYYGLSETVPEGAYRGTDLKDNVALPYTSDLVSHWPSRIKNTSQVPDSVVLYRKTLAAQADHTVIISSIGLHTNLKALLQSKPDEHSPLSGRDLFALKVRRLAVMGGGYPHTSSGSSERFNGGCECNFCAKYNGGIDHGVASAASAYVVANVPPSVEVIFSGVEVGLQVQCGGQLSTCAPASNPCRQAFIDFEGGPSKSRFSWDPLTTLVAVRGPEAASCKKAPAPGVNVVDASTGMNHWQEGKPSNQSYLLLEDGVAAGKAIDALLCEPVSSSKRLPTAAELATAAEQPGRCCAPGICVEPPSKFKEVLPIQPRKQWNIAGGFCGSLSMQVLMMGHGAWVSEDLIRKANIGAPCHGHKSPGDGCEVGPENYGQTAEGLRLHYDRWDYTQPVPQAKAFKAWIKAHLAKREPVMWAPMEKGEYPHQPYGPASTPGHGAFDHHEPMIGIGSYHSLSDPTVYDDDWLLHFSAQDLMPYYRNFSSLEDDLHMNGNCKDAGTGYPDREAYPCFYEKVAYGLATKGFITDVPTLPVVIDVDRREEPNVRTGAAPAQLHAKVTVFGLKADAAYVLYRYTGFNAFPAKEFERGYEHKVEFTPKAGTWVYEDPNAFLSNNATYYIAVPSS